MTDNDSVRIPSPDERETEKVLESATPINSAKSVQNRNEAPATNVEFENLLRFLKLNRAFDFTGYKRSSLMRRIDKRMQAIGIEDYESYQDYLEVHSEEFAHLFDTILINVTGFFRDPAAWEYVASELIPRIVNAKEENEPIRVWSACCASGEEAYTLAILLAEALGADVLRDRVKLYATDVDPDALNKARLGSYTEKDVEGIPLHLLSKYFERTEGRYVFRKDLRRSLIFGRHDLIQDAPISRIDLLVCRNALMYFNAETQARIMNRLHFALQEGGFLFIGKAEMLFTHGNLFAPIDLKHRVFTRLSGGNSRVRLLSADVNGGDEERTPHTSMFRNRDIALETGPVAQILVGFDGMLALANERARSLFHLSPRDIGRPLQDLELSYRPVELRSRIEQAYAERRAVILLDTRWPISATEIHWFDVQITPLMESDTPLGVAILFTDVTHYHRLQENLEETNQALEAAYEELQSTNEELETTNEELQSTVEELETTNEELQSTNEELETMNEELQSTNEELQTINDELRQRSDELNQANMNMDAILTSVQAGVVVVDAESRVQVWNRRAEDLWGLRFNEVLNQHFMSLDFGLPADQLSEPLRVALSGEVPSQSVALNAINRRGRRIVCEVTLNPLYDGQRLIRGVILLMNEAAPNKDGHSAQEPER